MKKAGGIVLAEAEETAVVYGMPKAAVATGCVDEVLPLPKLVQRIAELLPRIDRAPRARAIIRMT